MRIGSTALAVLAVVSLLACQTNTGTVVDKKATQGAILGGLAGAAAGAAIGGHDHRGGGALIGAATGAIAGGMVGHYLDKQAQELDAIPGATVQRRDDSLLVNFESEILFDSGSATLFPGSFDQLRALAQTLNRYPKSDVIIKGHTDSVGEEAFNQTLSERRADGVRNFLIAEAVAPPRITAIGFGESVPVASNDTAVGRQRNRRVEIEIRPYDEVLRGEQTQ
jgi:outer membrane protein OmpA-like peptidoglycan-associated protein